MLTYIELVDGHYGNRTRVVAELLYKGESVDIPEDACLVLGGSNQGKQ